MIHSFAKLISKMLALRLAPRMDEIVDKNHNAFIRTRSIHDNYKYVQRAAVLIRKKKVPMLLLKLDISKAFDTLSWHFLLEILQANGFGEQWRRWIKTLLSTATSWIILNGQHGPTIWHLRGLPLPIVVHYCHGRLACIGSCSRPPQTESCDEWSRPRSGSSAACTSTT